MRLFVMIFGLFITEVEASEKKSLLQVTEDRPTNFSIELAPEYDAKKPPKLNGAPAVVQLQIHPWKIGEISFERMTFEVDVYFSVLWRDYRLTFRGNEDLSPVQRITLNSTESDKIWKPVVSFRNVMGSKGMTVDAAIAPLRIRDRSLIFFVIRKVDKFHCKFNLAMYPLDTQTCFVEIQGLSYKADVMLQDTTTIYELRSGSDPPQFKIIKLASGVCSTNDGSSKYYSCVEYKFVMQRQIGHHLMLTYAPSFLIVLLTWISFWLDVNATPARIGLGLTSLLTLATQFANAQKNLPPVSYTKAIDVWMFTCIFMVFASIVEFAIANYNSRNKKTTHILPQTVDTSRRCYFKLVSRRIYSLKQMLNTTDETARLFFPVVFLIFNICYWCYYGTQ